MTNSKDFEAFRHGLVVSKVWLCEQLEPILEKNYTNPSVNILGGWHNVLSFIMQVRKPNYYKEIISYDKDESVKTIADLICDTWKYEVSKVSNITSDTTDINFDIGIFINCSVDQYIDDSWYRNIPHGSLVCMQTTNIMDENPLWEINQRTPDLNTFKQKYQLDSILYEGVKEIRYDHFGYDRLMLIGYK